MKKFQMIFYVIFIAFLLAGCSANDSHTENVTAKVRLVETKTNAQDSGFQIVADLEKVEADAFGQGIHDEIEREWQEFHSLTQEQLWASSHTYGHCSVSFDTWAEAIEFLGIAVPNPLEEMTDLTVADSSAVPLDSGELAGKRQHVQINWYGTEDKKIPYAHIDAGYLDGNIRIALSAMIYGEDEEEYTTDYSWAESVTFENEMIPMKNGNAALVIVPNDPGDYSSADAFFVQDNVLYTLHLVGPKLLQEKVMESLKKVLEEF